MANAAAAESGVLLLLRKGEEPAALVRRIQGYKMKAQGVELPRPEPSGDLRTYGVGAQILADIGVKQMRLILSAPKRVHALSGFGLEVLETIPYE